MSKRKTIPEILEEFKNKHCDKYDYSLIQESDYKDSNSKLPIICHCTDEDENEHGIFYQDRKHHLRGHGCPKCAKNGVKYTNEEFIKKVSKEHPELDFSKTNYINAHTSVIVGCKIHGYFEIPAYYLNNYKFGCPKCGNSTKSSHRLKTTEQFIEDANIKHDNKYDYSKVEYYRSSSPIIIICHKTDKFGIEHGEFKQSPNIHLSGHGCPKCKMSVLENKVYCLLNENNIKNEYERHFDWLGLQSLDFYLPEYDIAIECQGTQHYIPTNFGSKSKTKEELFEYILDRDKKKYELCKEHGIDIIYFSNNKECQTCGIQHISSKIKLLKKIREYEIK